ncbi:MAG: 3-oxoacyl-[acyl-carrier-protein] reductase [Eubacteriales bacterium]
MLTGKTAVVTGGSRGIGRAVCVEFAKNHADVAFIYAGNKAKAEETLGLLSSLGVKARGYECDIADDNAVKDTFAKITEDFSRIDILVNNAGITRDKLAVMMSPEEFRLVVDVNLNGAFYCAKQALAVMLKQKSGKIINITSVSGLSGNPGQANYSSSKAGLIGLTKTLAREYASKGVTCNAVAPGFVRTDMTEPFLNNEKVLAAIPLKRFASPEEIAKLTVFLASPAADYITGEVVRIDGGMAI